MGWEILSNVGVYDTEEPPNWLYDKVTASETSTGDSFVGRIEHFNALRKDQWVDTDNVNVTSPGDVTSLSPIGWANRFVVVNSSSSDAVDFKVSYDGTNFVTNSGWQVSAGTFKELYLPIGASVVKLTTAGTDTTGRILASYDRSRPASYSSPLLSKTGSGAVATRAVKSDTVGVVNHGASSLTIQFSVDGVNFFNHTVVSNGTFASVATGMASHVRLNAANTLTCRYFVY